MDHFLSTKRGKKFIFLLECLIFIAVLTSLIVLTPGYLFQVTVYVSSLLFANLLGITDYWLNVFGPVRARKGVTTGNPLNWMYVLTIIFLVNFINMPTMFSRSSFPLMGYLFNMVLVVFITRRGIKGYWHDWRGERHAGIGRP